MKTEYRADIDGLRAIAVLAVVLNHAKFEAFPGGYIGVDVFFVISGYLITTILAREIQQNDFSIIRFYERRIRRIFPALFAMLAIVTALSIWLYNAKRLFEFSQSLLATTLFYSNFLFWSQAGYFDGPSLLKPLLHTWSLAVEEQFYIIFPILLFLLHRYAAKYVKPALITIAAASFALSVYGVYGMEDDYSTAFYLLHMRAWELLAGGLIALGIFRNVASLGWRNAASLFGLLLIGYPIFTYTETTAFPGPAALPPVLGTALIIWAGENGADKHTLVGKLLSLRPMVFIGLISYSLYLWHWPLLVFAQYYSITGLKAQEIYLALAAIFTISILSWQFVEKPFRFHEIFTRKKIFAFAAASMSVFLAAGFIIYGNKGFSSIAYFQSPDEGLFINSKCNLKGANPYNILNSEKCKIGDDTTETISFLLWGDSHARASGYGAHLAAKRNNLSGKVAFHSGCPPIILEDSPKNKCQKNNKKVMEYIKEHSEIQLIILDARWTIYYARKYKVEIGLSNVIEKLAMMNRKVVLIYPTPEIGRDVPSAYFVALRRQMDVNEIINTPIQIYNRQNRSFFKTANFLQKKYPIEIINTPQALCGETICPVVIGKEILYVDDNHVSNYGSELVSPLYDPIFGSIQH